MSRVEARRRAAEELAAPPSRNSVDALRVYTAWCEANSLPVLADDVLAERQLLRFLHLNMTVRAWKWGTCVEYARAVAQAYAHHDRPDPRGTRCRKWLLALQREQARTGAASRSDVIPDACIENASTASARAGGRVVRLRGVIAAAHALGVDPTSYGTPVQRLPRSAFLVRPEDIVITDARGQRHLLDRRTQPLFFAALSTALQTAGDGDLPLWDSESTRTYPTVQDTRELRAAWDRACAPAQRVGASAAAWHRAFEGSDQVQREWWLKCVDPAYVARTQDVAYLLVGVQSAHRHRTMERLTLGRMVETTTGFMHVVNAREHKGGKQSINQGGRIRTLEKFIDHLESEAGVCPAHCPACALGDHLAIRRQRGGRDEDPLWETSRGTVLRLGQANKRLRALLGVPVAKVDEDIRIGTRSLRVTAATLARRAGMGPEQIAADVTDHAKASTAELYIRRDDPFGFPCWIPLDVE